MTTIDPSEKIYKLDPQVTRILKRGDLTRINSNQPGKLKDHHGDLARVVKAEEVGPTLENSHPFVYDLELVLGGKLHGVFRADLLYTTATKEGMLDDSRRRRKRKQNTPFEAGPEADDTKKAKGRAGRKKKISAKKGKAATAAPMATKSTMSKKRIIGEKSKNKKSKQGLLEEYPNATGSHAMGLFERHRREFERSLGRLEKADAYNFFGTAVPPEFEEVYTEDETLDKSIHSESSVGPQHAKDLSLLSTSRKNAPKNTKESHTAEEVIRFPSSAPFNFVVIRKRMELGRYELDRIKIENEDRKRVMSPYWNFMEKNRSAYRSRKSVFTILHPKDIDWGLFRKDVMMMCDAAVERNKHLEDDDGSTGTLSHTAIKIKDLMEQLYEKNGRRHYEETEAANRRHRFSLAMDQSGNVEAAMQGKWRKEAFPERKYERLRGDVVCAGLSKLDEKIAAYELKTTLQDKFIGLAYKYDDTGQSEGWMKSILDVTGNQSERQEAALALASDNGAIKAQVNASMQSLLIGVLDKVMTDSGVLKERELRCANEMAPMNLNKSHIDSTAGTPEFVVQEVWGIDCYTRRNVTICLETEFDPDTVLTFIEKWLLPGINACPSDIAHDIVNACLILEGLPFVASTSLEKKDATSYQEWMESLLGKALLNKVKDSAPIWLNAAAHTLRMARENLGPDFFRIHPKGHGSIVLCDRLEPNRLVTFYRGEVYPSWRWGEKIDAVSKIQQQKGLKPVLPDFFNMALERPQHDPRGYGLLFVDASRKSNHGSMLSHSCQPSCEVHVVAVNGDLRLAITTIREMKIGDELTFDYNAVTESLMEYQSAVCLCGQRRCSGSFLHFAAADCYQQVLNRNSPVASRLANLIKGCTKKVMADDDEKILKCHGFQTAAFGAVSVNRRNASALDKLDTTLDSMKIVPVWLQTYVADTLRYIEYERRALPIALICNDLYDESGNVPMDDSESSEEEIEMESEGESDETVETDRILKREKPEPTFLFYLRHQREYFQSLLVDGNDEHVHSATESKREVQKLASAHWKSLSSSEKDNWKNRAYQDWLQINAVVEGDGQSKRRGTQPKKIKKKTPKERRRSAVKPQDRKRPKISFQQADAEGVSAMEQRIQQLTQSLSRVGRILDRHREATLRMTSDSNDFLSDEALREGAHSPLEIMPNENIVAWMWNHEDGIVRTLLKHLAKDSCVSPQLNETIRNTVSKHDILSQFGQPWKDTGATISFPMSPEEGRERLNGALLELRKNLLDGIQQMASVIKKNKAKWKAMSRKEERLKEAQNMKLSEIQKNRDVIKTVLDQMVSTVEKRLGKCAIDENEEPLQNGTENEFDKHDSGLDPWLKHYNKRFKIEKAADLLLFYAKTGYFFSINSYQALKSSPIEVYARELGNAVPLSTVDHDLLHDSDSIIGSPINSLKNSEIEKSKANGGGISSELISNATKITKELCKPEDIISNVVIEYQGDYVLSQLLQWYNGGIGQKPGLPDILGCALLPSMKGCWTVDGTTVCNSHTDRATRYQSTTRRRLVDWLKDPLQRGNPWPEEIRKAFLDKDEDGLILDATGKWLPLGSPILDFLVTGDDHSMNTVTAILSSFHSNSTKSQNLTADGLISTVDEGRPAEAVSNWVQCERTDCQKWRKVPWHIDIDMLPEQFFCKDNVWNPKSASCDAPEDVWDQTTDAQVGLEDSVDNSTLIDKLEKAKVGTSDTFNQFKLEDFRVGARFDVLREGKKIWTVGNVVKLDFGGPIKKIKVHFQKLSVQYDEWIPVSSPRLAPLYSKAKRPLKRKTSSSAIKIQQKKQATTHTNKSALRNSIDVDEEDNETNTVKDNQSHTICTDDSSMDDVFTQGSESDEEEETSSGFRAKALLENNIAEQSSNERMLDANESVHRDSEEEDTALPGKESAVSTNNPAQNVSKPKSWTIPKKKSLSVKKKTLLPLVSSYEKGSSSAVRIPRKRQSEKNHESSLVSKPLRQDVVPVKKQQRSEPSPSLVASPLKVRDRIRSTSPSITRGTNNRRRLSNTDRLSPVRPVQDPKLDEDNRNRAYAQSDLSHAPSNVRSPNKRHYRGFADSRPSVRANERGYDVPEQSQSRSWHSRNDRRRLTDRDYHEIGDYNETRRGHYDDRELNGISPRWDRGDDQNRRRVEQDVRRDRYYEERRSFYNERGTYSDIRYENEYNAGPRFNDVDQYHQNFNSRRDYDDRQSSRRWEQESRWQYEPALRGGRSYDERHSRRDNEYDTYRFDDFQYRSHRDSYYDSDQDYRSRQRDNRYQNSPRFKEAPRRSQERVYDLERSNHQSSTERGFRTSHEGKKEDNSRLDNVSNGHRETERGYPRGR